jgi:hypothetical protein
MGCASGTDATLDNVASFSFSAVSPQQPTSPVITGKNALVLEGQILAVQQHPVQSIFHIKIFPQLLDNLKFFHI